MPRPWTVLLFVGILSILAVFFTLLVLTLNPSNPNVRVNSALYFDGAYPLPVVWSSVTHATADLAPVFAGWTPNQDFTIEWFQNLDENTNIPRIFSVGTEANTLLAASLQGPAQQHAYLFLETVNVYQTPVYTEMPVQNTWTHVALVRKNNTASVYCNGKAAGNSFAFPYDFSTVTDTSLTLGNYAPNYAEIDGIYRGYLSSFRITNGALYTKDFKIPSAPLSSITQYPVSFLLQVATSATALTDSGIYGISLTNTGVKFTLD